MAVLFKKVCFARPWERTPIQQFRYIDQNEVVNSFIKDFGCSEHSGDVFWFVSTLLNISYQKTLVTIANDFGLIKNPTMAKNKPVIEYKGEKVEETSTSTIQCEIKAFTEQELKWWRSFGISQETLNFYKVFSIKNIFLNGNIFLLDNQRKKVFGYYGGTVEGKEYWKIYFPTDGKRASTSLLAIIPGPSYRELSNSQKKEERY